jgi:hypothetical protein
MTENIRTFEGQTIGGPVTDEEITRASIAASNEIMRAAADIGARHGYAALLNGLLSCWLNTAITFDQADATRATIKRLPDMLERVIAHHAGQSASTQ